MTDQDNLTRRSASARSEEDPLEELARIVSGDLGEISRPRSETAGVTVDGPKTPKEDNFAADLEAELEREIFGDSSEDDVSPDHGAEFAELDEAIAAEELPDEAEYEAPTEVAPEAGMSLEDQLMAELENRAARHQKYQEQTASEPVEVEAAETSAMNLDTFADPEPQLQELADELEELAGTFQQPDEGPENFLDFDREDPGNDPYARRLDENLRSVAADETAARATQEKAAETARGATPSAENEPEAIFQEPKGAAAQELSYQRANLDLSDAFRAELEQIEEITSKRRAMDTADTEEKPLPAEVDRSDAFAKAFELELQDEPVKSGVGRPQGGSGAPKWADDIGVDEQPGPPPVMRHLRSEETAPDGEYYEYADDELFNQSSGQPETDEIEEFESKPFIGGRHFGVRMAAVALLVALVAGGGAIAYGYLFDSQDASGEPPVIRADTDPIKIKPDDPGGATIDNQDKASYEQVTGQFSKETNQEQLVKTAEKPIDVSALTGDNADADTAVGMRMEPAGAPMIIEDKTDERLGAPAADSGEIPMLAPRKVRTVVVKPDGTIVPPQENSLSVVSLTDTKAPDDGTIDGARSTGKIAIPIPRPDFGNGADSVLTNTVTPVSDDARSLDNLVNTASISASEQTAAMAGGDSVWAVQVASRRSAEDAQQTFQAMRRDYPGIIQDKEMSVQQAEIEGRGTFYRVRVMAESRDEAIDLCTRLKSAGGSCFVTR
jgi:SPOR domain